MLARRGITTVIPQKKDEIAARKRRHFALAKQWRGLATRHDKLAITYRAAAVLSACITWSCLLGDAP